MKRVLLLFSLFLMIFPGMLQAAKFRMPAPGNDVVGELSTVYAQPGDTLEDLADRHGIGFHEIVEANRHIHTNELYGGEEILIPTQYVLPKYRKGIVINVAELRLYYFTPDGQYVYTYPVGLGRKGWRTPTTSTTVVRKAVNPTWTAPSTIRHYLLQVTGQLVPKSMPPGPENPLGKYALYLGKHGYLIHGTNQPASIGKLVSAGCIRLFNSDVQELFRQARTGTPVRIVHHPYKAGWNHGQLVLEAHVPIQNHEPESDLNMNSVAHALKSVQHGFQDLNWGDIERITTESRGIPQPIGLTFNRFDHNFMNN